ncbi:alcohol dehydrogenase [Streptomyces sp. IMTB 2501]|uniref:alcohol dehydrogenase catalytic domain-containing protein n=1 Tax=Streptomyces sp. IMTB 2501 TaxID=1776340 RepID=UPI00096F74F0|nr:alcohol dehydrogenase catalytic domain-containing protein [Streptomyces sp. IMTB 2501]OLZ72894.1 alcohol dehydrogenase [Streptomyces sp. IMTB 2501]
MKVLRYRAPGNVALEEAPDPTPGPGEVVLRVRNCSLCGTDVKIYHHGHQRIVPPRVLGHEIAGEVVLLGEGSSAHGLQVGDRVQLIGAIPCGSCRSCRDKLPTVCTRFEAMGYHYDGGFAEFVTVPGKVLDAGGLHRMPDALSFAEASLAEPLACVLNGQELARVGKGDDVVVVGAGPVGCMHVRLARARGANRVLLVELDAARLELAKGLVAPDEAIFGADVDVAQRILDLTEGRGADVVLLAAASAQAQQQALHYTAPRGRVSLFGSLPPGSAAPVLDTNLAHYRELTIVGSNSSHPGQNAEALELISSGAVPVADLITHTLPLDRTVEGIRLVESRQAMKVTIEP